MKRTITGTGLYIVIAILFTIWYMVSSYASPPLLFHTIGVVAVALFIFRIIRGDD